MYSNKVIHKFPEYLPLAANNPNFVVMSLINWAVLNPDTSYYLHNQYLLFRRRLKGYFVYTIWRDNVMVYNSYNEYQFLQISSGIIKDELLEIKFH